MYVDTLGKSNVIFTRCLTRGPWAACGPGWLWMPLSIRNRKFTENLFFAHQFSWVFVYLMCGPRQLFFRCGPETPKGWTPLRALTGPGSVWPWRRLWGSLRVWEAHQPPAALRSAVGHGCGSRCCRDVQGWEMEIEATLGQIPPSLSTFS